MNERALIERRLDGPENRFITAPMQRAAGIVACTHCGIIAREALIRQRG